MIDIHNHVLPAVDDGAKSPEIALAMLEEAVQQGVEHMVLTPHLYEADIIKGTREWRENIESATRVLREIVDSKKLPIKLTVAAEIRYQDLLPMILDELDVLMGNKYLLLEFAFHHVPNNLDRIIYDITKRGVIPIIAHPERIKPWQREPQKLEALINMGCPTQLDIGSFLGTLGPNSEKLAHFLFERDAVHLVGSDSHNLESRAVYTKPGYDWLVKEFGADYANLLLMENPKRILAGENVDVYPVDLSPAPKRWTDKLKRIFKS